MSQGTRVELYTGATILFPDGPRLVVGITPMGYVTRDTTGQERPVAWVDIEPARRVFKGKVDAVATSVAATFAGLSEEARQEALDRQEVILTIDTGYANGHPALARPGEPFTAFDSRNGWSLAKRFEAMSLLLEQEAAADRRGQRARESGQIAAGRLGTVGPRTIRLWHSAYHQDIDGGLFGLIDGRRLRSHKAFDSLDPEIIRVAGEVVGRMDGTWSIRSVDELYRLTLLALKTEGLQDLSVPEGTLRKYLSHQKRQRGRTTRSNLTNRLRGISSISAFPALRPGQVVAVDVTRADNFVIDPWSGKSISVEIFTALDVCTRVVLALRVVPRSATSIEAGLLLYDILRPFSQSVAPDRAEDWRWAGVPEYIGPIEEAVVHAEGLSGRPLIGEHAVPGLLPEAIRADHGSIFTSQHFRTICDSLDIHLLLSRGKKPTDNAFVERWHETLQRCLQQLSGHKARNVAQRGSDAGKLDYDERGHAVFRGEGSGLTPRQLEVRLREFVATDYHRTKHTGITIADRNIGEGEAWTGFSPLECFDAMLEATGRVHILQRPDLLYDLLPIRWGTIRHDGVEFKDLTYDCHGLDEFRNVPAGFFRDQDRAAPFFYDPRDVSRVWFRHPHTDEIIEVPWRRAFQLQAPMTEVMYRRARSIVRRRGGTNHVINKATIQTEILTTINDIADIERLRASPDLEDWKISAVSAAHMRTSRAAFDHAEAVTAAAQSHSHLAPGHELPAGVTVIGLHPQTSGEEASPVFTPWPDYDELDH